MDKNITCKQVEDVISASAENITDVVLFDVYEGEHVPEGKKSVAISVTYSSDERTLNEKEITEMENRIKFELTKQFHAELRG